MTLQRTSLGRYEVRNVTGDKVPDETAGNRLVNLVIELRVTFPEGAAGVVDHDVAGAAR